MDNANLDLSAFDVKSGANEGFRVELVDKTGRKSGHWVEVLGRDSDDVQKVINRQNRMRLQRMQKGAMGSKLTPEELEDDAIEVLAAATRNWSFKDASGAPYPCTSANAASVYKASVLIKEQVDAAIADRANFIKG